MKTADRNLLLLGIPAFLILVLGIALLLLESAFLNAAHALFESTLQGEVEDVAGYALLMGMIGFIFYGLAGFALKIAAVAAVLYGGLLLALNTAARILYRNTPGRILAYRIVMGVVFFLLLLPAPALIQLALESILSSVFPTFSFVCLALIGTLTLFGCRNTYTDRIRDGVPPMV